MERTVQLEELIKFLLEARQRAVDTKTRQGDRPSQIKFSTDWYDQLINKTKDQLRNEITIKLEGSEASYTVSLD